MDFFIYILSIQLYKEIEICQKITQHVQIEKSDTSSDIYGKFSFCFGFIFPSLINSGSYSQFIKLP